MEHNELVSLFWGAKEILRGDYHAHEYGDIILPFVVLRRLGRVLEPSKDKVLEEFKKNGIKNCKIDGSESSEWQLIDGIDLIVHIFYPEKRKFY